MGKLTDSYNLKKINPKLAKEWHPTKNGKLTPMDVTPSSARKVWWICVKNHEWKAKISSRNNGSGCPYCARYADDGDNLLTKNSELSKEWHTTKNGVLTPRDVTLYSSRKVWWICEKNHKWEASINNRTMGTKCPYCAGKAVCEDNKINKSGYHLFDNRFNKWHLQGDFLRLRSEQVNAPKAHKPLLSRLKGGTFNVFRVKCQK